MNPADLIVIAVILAVIGFSLWYICRSRKKGLQCVGCPDAKNCGSKGRCSSCGGCGGGCH